MMDEGLVTTLDLCLAVTHFESWLFYLLFDRLSAQFSWVSPDNVMIVSIPCLKTNHDQFLPHPYLSTIHEHVSYSLNVNCKICHKHNGNVCLV
jgi:hypothetical protein